MPPRGGFRVAGNRIGEVAAFFAARCGVIDDQCGGGLIDQERRGRQWAGDSHPAAQRAAHDHVIVAEPGQRSRPVHQHA